MRSDYRLEVTAVPTVKKIYLAESKENPIVIAAFGPPPGEWIRVSVRDNGLVMTHYVHVVSRENPDLRLTEHMVEILRLIAGGKKAREISQELGIAVHTVYEYAGDIRRLLRAKNDAELVRLAIYHGFIEASRL